MDETVTVAYHSNITGPDLLPAFPHAVPFVVNGHLTHHDKDFDTHCGYLSQDEAAILYTVAKAFPGLWIEVGSHTGWSSSHIAAAGNEVIATEPSLAYRDFYRRAKDNWRSAGVDDLIYPYPNRAELYFEQDATDAFAGAFIDGDHEPGMPLRDAVTALPRMQGRCVIAFHDFVGYPVQDAVSWLVKHQGFRFRIYNTGQMLAVCWRGDWDALEHVPDPTRDWVALRASHTDFDYSRET